MAPEIGEGSVGREAEPPQPATATAAKHASDTRTERGVCFMDETSLAARPAFRGAEEGALPARAKKIAPGRTGANDCLEARPRRDERP
jgi:hypothetical protein